MVTMHACMTTGSVAILRSGRRHGSKTVKCAVTEPTHHVTHRQAAHGNEAKVKGNSRADTKSRGSTRGRDSTDPSCGSIEVSECCRLVNALKLGGVRGRCGAGVAVTAVARGE